jgi:flagellar protein FlbB
MARRDTERKRWPWLRIAFAALLAAKLVLVGLSFHSTLAGAAPSQAPAPRLDAGTPVGTAPVAAAPVHAAPSAGAVVAPPTGASPGDKPATLLARATSEVAPAGEGGKAPQLKDLLDAVSRRQAELDRREQDLTGREERLQMYEKDVTAKVASLEEIEKRLSGKAKAAAAAGDAAAESLAKVYGAMKPAEAAPLLEHLDDVTVLRILHAMKEKQLGEILPLINRDKAVTITRALADRR